MDAVRRTGAFVAGQIASEAPGAERLRRYDLILTSFPHFVDDFRGLGVACRVLPHRLRPARARPSRRCAARARHRLRRRAERASGTGAGTASSLRPRRQLAARLLGLRPARPATLVTGEAPLPRRALGPRHVPVFASSRIVLNRHIGAARQYANNMRLYEATGVGSLLLTDAKVESRRAVRARSRGGRVSGRRRPRRACAPLPRRRRRQAGDRDCRPGADAAGPHVCDEDARARRDPRGTAGDSPGARALVRRQARADHRRPRVHRLEPRPRARRARRRRRARRLARPGIRRAPLQRRPGSRIA